MQVSMGLNSEFGREKFQVTVEEADLARLCAEQGIDPARLTVAAAYMLVYLQAEEFFLAESRKYREANQDLELGRNHQQMAALLGQLRGAPAPA